MPVPTVVIADKVKELSTTTGTGGMVLSGVAPGNFQTFLAGGLVSGDRVAYVIDHQGLGVVEWEVGYGTFLVVLGVNTLQRDEVTDGTNGTSLVDFSLGTKHIGITMSADLLDDMLYGMRAVDVGGTGSDLSATVGLIRQATAGAAFTAGQLLITDFSDNLITNAKIVSLAASKIAGTLTHSQVDPYAFSNITGTASAGQIPTLPYVSDAVQSGRKFAASPADGSSGAITLRAIVAADIPALPYLTTVAFTDVTGTATNAQLPTAISGKTITASTLNSTIIGGTTAAAGTFTAGTMTSLTINNPSSVQYPVTFKDQNGFTAVQFNLIGGDKAGYLLLDAPVGQGNGAGIDFRSNVGGATRTGLFTLDSSGNFVFRQGAAGSMFFDYNAGVFFRRGSGAATTMSLDSAGHLTFGDAINVLTGTTTGTKFGTSVSQKMGWWNATPVVQPAAPAQAIVAVTGATNVSPYGFTTAAQADAIITLLNEIRRVLVLEGLMKGAA
jgi:hypothetical protein